MIFMDDFIEAGKVINTHGIKGDLKIEVWLDSPEMLKKVGRVFIDGSEMRMLRASVQKTFLISHIDGVESVDDAVALKGKILLVRKSDIKLPKGRYFISDILGFDCIDISGRLIGSLVEVIDNPAQLIYVIKGDEEHLVPAVPEFIKEINTDARTIKVNLIEGM